jgi:hypothetical protein
MLRRLTVLDTVNDEYVARVASLDQMDFRLRAATARHRRPQDSDKYQMAGKGPCHFCAPNAPVQARWAYVHRAGIPAPKPPTVACNRLLASMIKPTVSRT